MQISAWSASLPRLLFCSFDLLAIARQPKTRILSRAVGMALLKKISSGVFSGFGVLFCMKVAFIVASPQ